jgi:uncharacterized protein YndB with AHSA1/START domain
MSGVPGGLALDLRCTLNAPREQIFRALTEPAELVKWWGPSGFTTPEIEVDLSVGGGYRFGMQPPDGGLFHLAGEFLEIEPPSKLAYTFRWEEPDPDDRETVVRLSLQAAAVGITELSLSQGQFATEARLALHEGGWTDSFERLSELIESDT